MIKSEMIFTTKVTQNSVKNLKNYHDGNIPESVSITSPHLQIQGHILLVKEAHPIK